MASNHGTRSLFMRMVWLAAVLALAALPVQPTHAQAEQLSYGAFTSNTIDEATPARFYEFTGAAGDIVAAEAIALNNTLDPQISLLSSGQSALALSTDDPFQPGSLDARLTYILPAEGVYTVLVQSENRTSGQFVLRLDQIRPLEAEALSAGIIASASITPDLPSRAFTFDSASASTISVSSPAAGVGFVVEVRAQNGQVVAVQRGPLVTSASTTVAPNSGVYTVIVSTTQANQSATLELLAADAAAGTQAAAAAPAPDAGGDAGDTDAATSPTAAPVPDTAAADSDGDTGDGDDTDDNDTGDDDTDDDTRAAASNAPEGRCTVVPEGSGGVNVRNLPTTDAPVIASIPPGEFRYAEAWDGAWIRLQGGGWVSSGVVEQSAACAGLERVTSPVVQTQQAQQAAEAAPTSPPQNVAPIGQQ